MMEMIVNETMEAISNNNKIFIKPVVVMLCDDEMNDSYESKKQFVTLASSFLDLLLFIVFWYYKNKINQTMKVMMHLILANNATIFFYDCFKEHFEDVSFFLNIDMFTIIDLYMLIVQIACFMFMLRTLIQIIKELIKIQTISDVTVLELCQVLVLIFLYVRGLMIKHMDLLLTSEINYVRN
ncbi:PREDICTED: uncharacterized protein LOC108565694 [Nicrophorus vespilloides]|uniref:Uncharacterized protein LOC108565694 n=1 Tax=Nicrophorus vespilloides TaxID=110193 RepID=A0ABM1N1R0_NICVS|nr:PREDICTED: uncharacterized protein LOC108565694 [Nicrophorus vespilloides]